MSHADFDEQITPLAALGEPIRRRLYLYVASRHDEVGRDEAARALGISRTLAGFHLDRLADEGLLETSFRRLTGKTGPGAGRPAKLYRRSSREVAVSLPPRSYELAARILAAAMDQGAAPETKAALERIAQATGEGMAEEVRAREVTAADEEQRVDAAIAVLASRGYEPSRSGSEIRLRNCPFHALAAEHRGLVCGMNLALIQGMVSALDLPRAKAVLDPKPGMCCVALDLGAA